MTPVGYNFFSSRLTLSVLIADCACTFIRALFLILKMGLMHVMNLNFPNELSENKKWFSQ